MTKAQIKITLENVPEGFTTSEWRLFNICTYYTPIRPALKFVAKLLTVKPKLKAWLVGLMVVLDAICDKTEP